MQYRIANLGSLIAMLLALTALGACDRSVDENRLVFLRNLRRGAVKTIRRRLATCIPG
ncbi:hypothetical protein [Herbaspirillum sp. RV1423]|uniref:hypothetical protein n=1 Tax=Herbaspirillum sp. RV1423 TaxID=1443993 RepID=UPI0004B67E98|nr:hypothetical protein [Herbaspirillum sp. RV1423]